MLRLVFTSVLVLAAGCTSAPDLPEEIVVLMDLSNAAQRIKAEHGFEAAIPALEAAAHAGGSFAAVSLWDHYDRLGEDDSADVFKQLALTSTLLDEAEAWRFWAFRGHDTGSQHTDILAGAERLREGVREGSPAAASELASLIAELEARAATGNPAARRVLDDLPEATS